MHGTTRYFACKSLHERRELDATSTAQAFTMLQPDEILSGEYTPPVEEQIRQHARSVVLYRNLHRSAIARITLWRSQGRLSGRSLVLALAEAASYRRQFASQRRLLDRALHRAAALSCNEATCSECLAGAA